MVQIAFVLLCHRDPGAIISQARRLTAAGDCVAIHFDGRAPRAAYSEIRAALDDNPNVTFARRRLRCGWGEWSLVAATLETVRAGLEAFPRATHFYMVSGDCMPTKSAEYVHDFLAAEDADYIESVDFFDGGWIRTGFVAERLIYRHFFNERTRKRLFYGSYKLQKRLGLKRKIPTDLRIMIGSQWWCLRRQTVQAVLDFCAKRRDVVRFFATTWIPDETFFQSLVRHLVPREEIRSRTLTFLMFSDYGMPVTFYNDHHDLLLAQNALFARKISADATQLKARLGELYAERGRHFVISGEGKRLHRYLTGRGREGRRFAPRFWDGGGLDCDKELLLVVCKKWHVAKRLVEAIRQATDLPAVDYVFNELQAGLPDLGGIETRLDKRMRHRRVLVSMLFGYFQSRRLILCLDPAKLDVMRDFAGDRATTRILEVECNFDDAFLSGHAARTGLAGAGTSPAVLSGLITTLRGDIAQESDRIRAAGFSHLHRLRQSAPLAENALSLAEFLSIPEATAREIAATGQLFAD